MSTPIKYFLLSGKGRDNYTTQNRARWVIRDTWLCTGCMSPKVGTNEVDIAVQEPNPISEPLGMIWGTDVGAGKLEIFTELGLEQVHKSLYLGKLLQIDGVTPFPDMVTYHGKHRIIVRGKSHAHYRRCDKCDRFTYFAMEDDYLYPQPPPSIEIFDKGNGALVVTERFARRINVSKWEGLSLKELPVLSKPLDGFDELVSPYATSHLPE